MRYDNEKIEFRAARVGDVVLLPVAPNDLRIGRAVQIGKELRFGHVEVIEYLDGTTEGIQPGRLRITISAPTAYDIWNAIKQDSLFEPRYSSVSEFTRIWVKAGLIRDGKTIKRAAMLDGIIKKEFTQQTVAMASA